MILSTYSKHHNFDPPTIHKFLTFSLLGNMETNATSLHPQEEELLFNLIHRLHCCQGIDVKGIWPILNLCFENRSGLIIMALFFQSQVMIQETFHKKTFVKDLKYLENRNFTIENLLKILQILEIKQLFQNKYAQFEQDLLRTGQRSFINTVPLNQEKLYGQNEYDSEPSFHKFQNAESIQDDLSQSNKSQIIFRPYQSQEIRSDQQDNTISIRASRKRRIGEGVQRQIHRKKHTAVNVRNRAKRPNRRQKRKKMLHHAKRQKEKLKLFTNIRKEKQRLRKYDLFQLDSQSEQQQRIMITQKKMNRKRNKNVGKYQKLNYLNSELELHSSQNLYMENEKENEGWSEQNKVNSDYLRHKKLRKLNRQQYNMIEQPIDQNQDISEQQSKQFEEYMIDEGIEQDNNENANQSIRNLSLIRIDFPQFDPNKLNQQVFYEKQWVQYILASTTSEKKTLAFIKQMVETKDQISAQSILKSFFTAQQQTLKRYCNSYFQPILVSKLSKIITHMIANIIEILYTQINFSNTSAIHQKCACLAQLKQIKSVDSKIGIYLSKALSLILGDFYQQVRISQTKSNIEIGSSHDLLKNILRIKLSKQELKHTILIAMLILFNGFLAQFIRLDNNQFYQTHLPIVIQQSVKIRPFLLNSMSQIFFRYYGLVIKDEQDQLKALGIGKNVQLNNRESIEAVTCFVTRATQYYINKQVYINGHNINPITILNRLSTTGLVGKYRQIILCKSKQQNLEIKQILLSFYDKFLQFQQMQSFRVIDPILRCITQIKLNDNIRILSKIIGILQKAYWISKRKPFGQQNKNEVEISANIIKKIKEIFKLICHRFITYAEKSNYKASQKYIEEYFKLIQYVFDKIIMIFPQDPHHYTFSLNLIVTHAYPILFKLPKENQQFINLSRRIVKKVQEVQVVVQKMKKQIDQEIQLRIIDEQDEANAFFEKQSQVKLWINKYKKLIEQQISHLNFGNMDIKTCFEVVRKYKDNNIYEAFGVFVALACLDLKKFDSIKNELFYQLKAQSTEIKIEKYLNFSTTNKFIVPFLNGYLKALGLFLHLGINNNLTQNIKASILNTLFLRLICQRQSKSILQLMKMPYIMQIFQKYEHIMLNIPFEQIKPTSPSAVRLDMLLLRHERIPYRGQYLQFCKSNIDVIINLYKQYQNQQNKQMIPFIAHNFMAMLVFLMKSDARKSIVTMYRNYFDINNCVHNENILKGLSLKDQPDFDSSHLLIELLKTSEQKKRYNMTKLPKQYMEYFFKSQLKFFRSNQSYKFVKVNLIMEGLNQCCTVLSQYPLKIDQITSNLTKILLRQMFGIVSQTAQYQITATFLSFFKVHLELRNVFLTAFQENFNAIFNKFTSNMTNFVDIQDFIMNEVVDERCNFEKLLKLLQNCQKRRINGMNFKKLQKMNEILTKCISIMQVHQKNEVETIEKYKNSLINLLNQEKQLRKKLQRFEQMVSSRIQQN